ncbi:hypothetical protein C8R48DRAFT_698073 [Suillus tomentosus]|nr:hypothetical protein C8R48DRAFT_698073 [Suillus tomentosus]
MMMSSNPNHARSHQSPAGSEHKWTLALTICVISVPRVSSLLELPFLEATCHTSSGYPSTAEGDPLPDCYGMHD